MGFFEICMVLIVAVIFLGPEKLPKAMVDLAKFFKALKKTMDEAKSSLDEELKLQELKQEALEYKNTFAKGLDSIKKDSGLDEFHSILDDTPSLKPEEKHAIQNELNAQSLKDKEQNISLSSTQEIGYKKEQ
ncbi:Sec-independent protein translocase protein TatB [uncultured Helicobacter sp.]|uniref:Sec-independent protein translocase protein TatB n=1 Tax=uncultured Helicobacter sp. TaxID=175537 RepID=UPI00261D71EA|nr:Sec-independent protein translocase protein TatB [uncultured Helicobacter sp.]